MTNKEFLEELATRGKHRHERIARMAKTLDEIRKLPTTYLCPKDER